MVDEAGIEERCSKDQANRGDSGLTPEPARDAAKCDHLVLDLWGLVELDPMRVSGGR